MNTIEDTGKFTMTIPLEAHRLAQMFRVRQADPAKGKQIYLNTLAVYAVHLYLQALGIATDLEASPSWDPVTQALLDTGALQIGRQGQLECRPVLPNSDGCYVPPDVWSDRLGYVAVQFDSQLEQAALLGFLPQVSRATVPLSEFNRLEEIIDYLEDESSVTTSAVTKLGHWLQDVFESGWQIVESLHIQPQPVFSFRNRNAVQDRLESQQPGEVTRGKLLNFGLSAATDLLALLISIAPAENSSFNIRVKVIPVGDSSQLPLELNVSVLDEVGGVIMQAQARETQTIELRFSGEVGDRFNVCLTLNDQFLSEQFVI